MYGQSNSTFPRADYNHQGGGGHHPPSPDGSASAYNNSHLIIPPEYLEMAGTTSESSSYDSLSSLASCCTCQRTNQQPSLIQRSMSSHSLIQGNIGYYNQCYNNLGCVEFEYSGSVRRAMSTGDLVHGMQHRAAAERESPLSSESNAIIESMKRASKCSPEEKKERIERYRTKRTQRNFNKKIKYACRKTLADSRPRVRGRFAKNDEIEKYTDQAQWSNASGEEDDIDDNDNWLDLLNAFSANSIP